jgi:hypothetical protein
MPPGNGTQAEPDTASVRLVQRALVDLGYLRSYDDADGAYGSRTSSAVSRFKADRGISPSDGIVGPKTSKALDDEFPPGPLDPGPLATVLAAQRVDVTIAGLLNRLSGLIAVPWAPQTALFAQRELFNDNLAGIVRASRASDLRTQIPASEHTTLDVNAAALASASPLTGPFATTTRFEQADLVRAYILVQDAFLDRAGIGDDRHTGALLMLAHELTHVRNRVREKMMREEIVDSANYVDVAKAIAFSAAGGDATPVTRAVFAAEIGSRHVAWRVYQELVGDHAAAMLSAGIVVRPAAIDELQAPLLPNQTFHSALSFAEKGVQPNQTYLDNGYMSDLLFGPTATFNQQVAMWVGNAANLEYHDVEFFANDVRNTLATEAAAQSPAFTTPSVDPAGLISA